MKHFELFFKNFDFSVRKYFFTAEFGKLKINAEKTEGTICTQFGVQMDRSVPPNLQFHYYNHAWEEVRDQEMCFLVDAFRHGFSSVFLIHLLNQPKWFYKSSSIFAKSLLIIYILHLNCKKC